MSFKGSLGKIGHGISSIFSSLVNTIKRVGLITGIAFTGAIIAGARFEDAMNRTFAIISGGAQMAGDQIESLTAKARELGRETLYSSTQAANGMQKLALAGFSANQILSAIGPTLNMAIVGNIALADAASISIAALKSFQMEASGAGKVADILAKAATSANVTVGSLGESMKYSAAVANAAGWSIEELAAAISQMGNAGFQGAMAGTALRRAMSMMLSPTSSAKKIMDKYGISTVTAAGKLKPLISIIGQLDKANVRAAEMFELFGLRAAPAMTAMVSMGVKSLSKLQKALENSAGTADRMSQKFRETIVGRFKDLIATLNEVAITITKAFDKSIADTLFGMRNWINDINEAIQANGKLKSVIDGLKAGLKPLIEKFEEIGLAVVNWIKGLSPTELKKKFKDIGAFISKVALGIMNVLNKVGSLLQNILTFDKEKFKATLEVLRTSLAEVFKGMGILLIGSIANAFSAVGPIIINIFKAIIDQISKMLAFGLLKATQHSIKLMSAVFAKLPILGPMFKNAEKDMGYLADSMLKSWMDVDYVSAIVKGMEEAAGKAPKIFERVLELATPHFKAATTIGAETGEIPSAVSNKEMLRRAAEENKKTALVAGSVARSQIELNGVVFNGFTNIAQSNDQAAIQLQTLIASFLANRQKNKDQNDKVLREMYTSSE